MAKLKQINSIRLRCYLVIFVTTAILCIMAMITTYLIHSNALDKRYTKLQETVARTVKGIVDADNANDYISGFNSEEHIKNNIRIESLEEDISDIYSIGVYKFTPKGMHTIFNTHSDGIRGGVGKFEHYTKEWDSVKDDIAKGKIIKNVEILLSDGPVAMYCLPLGATEDKAMVYACVGVLNSLTEKMKADFFAENSIRLLLAAIIFILLAAVYLELKLIRPVNKISIMASEASEISDSNLITKFVDSNIRTGDEVENINRSLIKIYTSKVRLNTAIAKSNNSSTDVILSVMKRMDNFSAVHLDNSLQYVILICNLLKKHEKFKDILTKKFCDEIILAAPMHDIGKLAIPGKILNKPGKLTEEEFEIMKSHTTIGENIIKELHDTNSKANYLVLARKIARNHHERWNGTGYPDALKGEEIPLAARIMKIADTFDALVSKRVYKEAYSFDIAFDTILKDRGIAFDPDITDVFEASKKKIYNLYIKLREDN